MGRKKKPLSERSTSQAKEQIKSSENNGTSQEKGEFKTETVRVEVKPSINITQHISGENVQVGSDNMMQIARAPDSVGDVFSTEGACAFPTTDIKPKSRKSYAEAVCYARSQETVKIVNNITINTTEKEEHHLGEPKYKEIRNFLTSVNDFKGHFILLLDKYDYENVENIDALAYVPWIMVMDFDPHSRSSGILSFNQLKLSKNRSLNICSVKDKSVVNERRTNWMFMTGFSERTDTLTSEDYKTWKSEISSSYTTHLQQLKTFGQDYTQYTLIVIWPSDVSKLRHIQYTIDEFAEILSPSIVLLDDGQNKTKQVETVLEYLQEDHHEIQKISLSFQDFCNVIASNFSLRTETCSESYQIPCQIGPEITEENAQWLSEVLEVLYLRNHTGKSYSQEELQQEEDNFFKGGTLPWAWWYRVGSGHLDVERDVMQSVLTYIRYRANLAKHGAVTLLHAPGSGGSTMAQRILWEMRKELPCAQVKNRSSESELCKRIDFLRSKSQKLILILVDGEDVQRVNSIERALQDYCVIILYVRRRPFRISNPGNYLGRFWLQSHVSKVEVGVLGLKYEKQCPTKKKSAIQALVKEVECGHPRSFFDFGLCMHDHEYKGLEAYVRGYLKLDETRQDGPRNWQIALAYLSLVYYYGQSSLPCYFLSKVLQDDKIRLIDDLPKEMKEFVVKDVNDSKKNVVRISHCLVAKEILDQVLTRFAKLYRPLLPEICIEAKRELGKFAVEFIKFSGEINKDSSFTSICKTMTRTFISRNNKTVGENETQANRKKQSKLSKMIEDVDSKPPYTERFDVLQQLTVSFPKEPQFMAHLGRLYTICRPEEEEKAEIYFRRALDASEVDDIETESMTHRKRLRNIYHMYGNMFICRIAKYTGRYLGDEPTIKTDGSRFHETGMQLLKSVQEACKLFTKCREITPPRSEESFGYFSEIQARLMFCDFVNCRSGSKNLNHYVQSNNTEIAAFVEECYNALKELFDEWFNVVEPEQTDYNVHNCQEWFATIFNTPIGRKTFRNDVQSRRMEIAKVKMKYSTYEAPRILELINSERDICFIVKEYERNFEVYSRQHLHQAHGLQETLPSPRAIDLDYREWLIAIRHRLFRDDYQIDYVLKHVQSWFERLNTPYARFYLFVLKSLLGIGCYGRSGNKELLLQAQTLKDEVLRHSKNVAKPRYPREWLGPATTTIRRLCQRKRFCGQHADNDNDVDIPESLEVRKGTICPPNDQQTIGFIALDIGPENRVPVKVFFIPARTGLNGTNYQGTRVEFVIGFSMSRGYEAFLVKQLIQITCNCKRNVEARSCDTKVNCHGCHAEHVVTHKPEV